MITFLPLPSFRESADVLDWKYSANRLNNQVNEGIIIAKTLLGVYEKEGKKGWMNHPAVLMWTDCEFSLLNYVEIHLETWEHKKQTFSQSRHDEIIKLQHMCIEGCKTLMNPWWLGDERLHSSHRAILLGKNWDWYKQFKWKEEPAFKDPVTLRYPYFWPVTKNTLKEKEEKK